MDAWQLLAAELDCWQRAGDVATFWWRDDDAKAPTPELELFLKHVQSVPVALSIIPKFVTPDLAARLRDIPSVVVLQHGWAHTSHAIGDHSEYPSSRSQHDVFWELAEGRRKLAGYFGGQLLSVFVPPWHAFDDCFLALLPEAGINHISRQGPRPSQTAANRLQQTNAHVDLLKWTNPPSFTGDEAALLTIVDHLRGRRSGHYDRSEPTGLLTHHRKQDEDSYRFIARLVEFVRERPAAKWLEARDVFRFNRDTAGTAEAFERS